MNHSLHDLIISHLLLSVQTSAGSPRVALHFGGQATATIAELRAKLVDYDKIKVALVGAKGRLGAASKRLKALEWDHEVHCPACIGLQEVSRALTDRAAAQSDIPSCCEV